jgi:hydroxyacylglutathione hydrolase
VTTLPVTAIPCLNDNYAWGIALEEGSAAVVDPSEAAPVQRWLDGAGLTLRWILLTHHHGDHIGGAEALARRHGARIAGAAADRHRLPPLDRTLEDGQRLEIGGLSARVFAVPGHTSGHLAFVVEDALFAGDALFSFGCGRVFEGTHAQMWSSMLRLRALPGHARLCCGHEYTAANLRFARHLLPDEPDLAQAERQVAQRRSQGLPTLPTPMGEQIALNPFLRCDDPAMRARLGLEDRAPAEVFAAIRSRKDRFRG